MSALVGLILSGRTIERLYHTEMQLVNWKDGSCLTMWSAINNHLILMWIAVHSNVICPTRIPEVSVCPGLRPSVFVYSSQPKCDRNCFSYWDSTQLTCREKLVISTLDHSSLGVEGEGSSPLLQKLENGFNSDPVLSTPTTCFPKSILLLSSRTFLRLPSGRFTKGFHTKILFTYLVSPHRNYVSEPSKP